MIPEKSPPASDPDGEVAALIETLHRTGQRLEELTAGEVDAVADLEGRPFVLRHAQEKSRQVEASRQASILNALPAHVALLDAQGFIISVNDAWRRFGAANALKTPAHGCGLNYLGICDAATGDNSEGAHEVAEGIRSVLAGREGSFSIEYPGHSPTEKRWFLLTVTPLANDHAKGAVAMHLDITKRKASEEDIEFKNTILKTQQEASPDGILTVDENEKIISYNQPFTDLWRLSPQVVSAGLDAPVLKAVADQVEESGAFVSRVQYLYQHRDDKSHEELRLKDGRIIDRYSAPVTGRDRRYYGRVWYFRDITGRKAAEQKIVHLSRVHAMLSGINTLIVRVRDRDELFAEACRIAVEAGGFRMSLIAMVDARDMKIVPVAWAGKDEALLSAVRKLLSEAELAPSTMVAQAIRKKEAIVSNDSQKDARVLLGKSYTESAVRSIAILPLIVAAEAVGVLALYSSEVGFFRAEEMKLLTELADDIAFSLGIIRARAEREKADEALRASLNEKEALLKEVHHRVKNNMQVITSLLRLESNRIDHPVTRSVLKDMQNRIQAMAALHEAVYRSGNFSQVDLATYLKHLTGQLGRSMVATPGQISFRLDLLSVGLDLDQAIPCGLIVNELVSNALKHGFPGGRPGEVRIEVGRVDEEQLRLRITDSGIGISSDFEAIRAKSLGLQLVSDLARQLGGSLRVGPGPAAEFEVVFSPTRTPRHVTAEISRGGRASGN